MLVIVVRKRLKELNKGPSVGVARIPVYGISKLAEFEYCNVKWDICYPNSSPYGLGPAVRIIPEDITVRIPPRCPKCGTELEESNNFWGGFTWKCVRCGFSKRNKDDQYIESDRAERIAKRLYEEGLPEGKESK